MPASTSASPLVGEVNVLALIKNNKFNYLLFVNYFLLYSTHIHNALHGASAHLPAELRAKVQRLAVSLRTSGPTVYPSTSRWLGLTPR